MKTFPISLILIGLFFVTILIIGVIQSNERNAEFERYLYSLEIGQVLDVNNKWIYLDIQTQEYNIYKACNEYACETSIKVKNDTIIEIEYRIPRR